MCLFPVVHQSNGVSSPHAPHHTTHTHARAAYLPAQLRMSSTSLFLCVCPSSGSVHRREVSLSPSAKHLDVRRRRHHHTHTHTRTPTHRGNKQKNMRNKKTKKNKYEQFFCYHKSACVIYFNIHGVFNRFRIKTVRKHLQHLFIESSDASQWTLSESNYYFLAHFTQELDLFLPYFRGK